VNLAAELLLALVGQLAIAAGVYAAIRADLREALTRASIAHDAARAAHDRIDRINQR
jgi:hypothetical protein